MQWLSLVAEHRLSSCGTWISLPHKMWDLPGPGIEPVSPALAGRPLATEPPGKPQELDLILGSGAEGTQTSVYLPSLQQVGLCLG